MVRLRLYVCMYVYTKTPDVSDVDVKLFLISRCSCGCGCCLLQFSSDDCPEQESQAPLHTYTEEADEHHALRQQVHESTVRKNGLIRVIPKS